MFFIYPRINFKNCISHDSNNKKCNLQMIKWMSLQNVKSRISIHITKYSTYPITCTLFYKKRIR